MSVYLRLCQMILLIFLISSLSGCALFQKDTSFEWLDIDAVPIANTDVVFDYGVSFRELAESYISLKHECRATNRGIRELRKAQDGIRKLR